MPRTVYSLVRQRMKHSKNRFSLPFSPSSKLPPFLEHDWVPKTTTTTIKWKHVDVVRHKFGIVPCIGGRTIRESSSSPSSWYHDTNYDWDRRNQRREIESLFHLQKLELCNAIPIPNNNEETSSSRPFHDNGKED